MKPRDCLKPLIGIVQYHSQYFSSLCSLFFVALTMFFCPGVSVPFQTRRLPNRQAVCASIGATKLPLPVNEPSTAAISEQDISMYLSQSLAESSSVNMGKPAMFVTRPCGCFGDKMKVDKATQCNLRPWIMGVATPRFLQVTSLQCCSEVMAEWWPCCSLWSQRFWTMQGSAFDVLACILGLCSCHTLLHWRSPRTPSRPKRCSCFNLAGHEVLDCRATSGSALACEPKLHRQYLRLAFPALASIYFADCMATVANLILYDEFDRATACSSFPGQKEPCQYPEISRVFARFAKLHSQKGKSTSLMNSHRPFVSDRTPMFNGKIPMVHGWNLTHIRFVGFRIVGA